MVKYLMTRGPQLSGGRRQGGFIDVCEHELHSLGPEAVRARKPVPVGAPGDHGNPPLEFAHPASPCVAAGLDNPREFGHTVAQSPIPATAKVKAALPYRTAAAI